MTDATEGRKLVRQSNSNGGGDYELLSREDVQDILGINEQTFYRYRRQYPLFKTIRTGRHTKMRRSTLEKFLEDLEERQSA